jgi:hypothetical protein
MPTANLMSPALMATWAAVSSPINAIAIPGSIHSALRSWSITFSMLTVPAFPGTVVAEWALPANESIDITSVSIINTLILLLATSFFIVHLLSQI